MKTILIVLGLSYFTVSAQSESQDSNQVQSASTSVPTSNSIIKTNKTDSAFIQLSDALTRLGVSVNNLAKEAGTGLEKGFDKLDANLKDETLFIQIGKAIERAANSIEKAADRLQRKIDDSASKNHKE
jgi:hypothetical protein